jgi:FtsP/CotA-like multicopper oxidase with cupredoxin domain
MARLGRHFIVLLAVLIAAALAPPLARAAPAPGSDPCVRPAAGSIVELPTDLYSRNGVLAVSFNYFTSVDDAGRTLFCFVTPDGIESPTLHVNPGDRLEIALTNRNPAPPPDAPIERVSHSLEKCGDTYMTITSVNIHFHGTNTSPICHADQVVHAIVNSGETFHYSVTFPEDEPPGLYWYHPHVHGMSEAAVQGGASGAIVVEGIQKLQPAVAGLKQRILLIRDQTIPDGPAPGGKVPSWDVSLNYVPILYPGYVPAVIRMARGAKEEFWRVVNASADTIVELKLDYDGVAQPLEIVALDGVPTGSQDGTRHGKTFTETSILLPPAARAEFIVTAPGSQVKTASLLTERIDTGPLGDSDPARPLATIEAAETGVGLPAIPAATASAGPQRFEGLATAKVTARRTLYFSEEEVLPPSGRTSTAGAGPAWGGGGRFLFFITVDGQIPTLFDPLNPPAITTTQGAVEDWTIENRSGENHEFHMHQIHFLLLERNGVAVPAERQQFLDTVQVPFWSGKGPYPIVTVRMDFRGADLGDFVYHCHILGHEDNGMMAIIRVLSASASAP